MDDIARLAKVSKPTVSRAFKDSPLVKSATKERILAIARRHGYSVNWNAQKLRTKRTHTIAVVMHLPQQSGEHGHFSTMTLFAPIPKEISLGHANPRVRAIEHAHPLPWR